MNIFYPSNVFFLPYSRSKHLKLPRDVSQSPTIVAEAVSLVRCSLPELVGMHGGLGLNASHGSSALPIFPRGYWFELREEKMTYLKEELIFTVS